VPAAAQQLVLLIPGLAGPGSDRPITDYLQARPAALDRLLSRSRGERMPASGLEASLAGYFGISDSEGLPVAALNWLADTGVPATQYLLCADPVHLRADQSCLRLFDAHCFPLTQQEADALVATINDFNAVHGWVLRAPHPQRWYLALPQAPDISTRPTAQVAGQDIDPCLPSGADAPHWHALMNELQMLLHDHPVNLAREQRGEPAINSLWFWGGGASPGVLRPRMDALYSDHPLAMGLSRHAGIPRQDLPADAGELLAAMPGGRQLVLLDGLEWPAHYNDIEDWLAELERLEQAWFAPLLAAVQQGRLAALVIDACHGSRFHTGRRRQRAFWRRRHPFERRLQP
jgi:hypothetical protein